MSFKHNSGWSAIFIDHDGSGNEILKAELKNSDGSKRIVTITVVEE